MRGKMLVVVMLLMVLFSTNCFAEVVEIYRDTYGVPHIYADSLDELYYGFGYSTAQDRLFQLEMLRRLYFGRVAEVFGEDYYASDIFWRNEYPTRDELEKQIKSLKKKYQNILTAYTDGINAWIREVLADPENQLPYEFHQLGFEPEFWQETDVAATYLASFGFFMDLSAEIYNADLYAYLSEQYGYAAEEYFNDLVWGLDTSAYTTIPSTNTLVEKDEEDGKNQWALLDLEGLMQSAVTYKSNDELNQTLLTKQGHDLSEKLKMGASKAASYAVVIGPERSMTGNAMLMGGPQFDFWLPSMIYEVGLHGAGFDVVGSTLVGTPFIMFGHTRTTAFTSTAGADNVQDIFEEKLNPNNPYQYFYNGEWVEMEERTEQIIVQGETAPREKTFYRTVHGPVIAQVDKDGDGQPDVAYTKQLSCFDTYLSGIPSWTDVMKAKNPEQFKRAARKLTLSINHFYADSKGNIGFYHSGKYPIRSQMENYDVRFPVPGTGEYEWTGFINPKDNPFVVNPSTGVIVNWNNKPREDWSNGDLASIFQWAGWSTDHRALRIANLLDVKDKISVDDLKEVIHDIADSDHRAFAVKSYLVEALETSTDPKIVQVKQFLQEWNNLRRDLDHDGYYDQVGYTLFNEWWPIVNEKIFADELGPFWEQLVYNYAGYSFFVRVLEGYNANVPLENDYLNGLDWKWVFVESMKEAIVKLEMERGEGINQWLASKKTMNFIPSHLGGIPTSLGEVREIDYMDRGSQNHIVELTRPVAIGKNICPPGQSGFISKDGTPSEHFSDQIDLFANWEYKDMLFTKFDVFINCTQWEFLWYNSNK